MSSSSLKPSSSTSPFSCTPSSTELDNLITMQHNPRTSANKGSNDAYDVHTSLTGYEPNDMVFNELGNSQGSFSYITPSSDLDIDEATLGNLLDRSTPRIGAAAQSSTGRSRYF